mgnify:CR=1 FL=1|jgi:hypothetical protein|tara:strand:+ start:3058 stop:3255 length:198 start_codon:yes stop_codon:yes gene_type:complete
MNLNKKRYILTIEYNDNEDKCEFIEERLIEECPDDQVVSLGYIELGDYFTESDLACVMEFNIGES